MRVAYICEAGEIGWGHFSRGRALIEQLPSDSALLVGRGFHEALAAFGNSLAIMEWSSPESPLFGMFHNFDIAVVDHYELPDRELRNISQNLPLVIVDDWMRWSPNARAVVNPNLGASSRDYDLSNDQLALCGATYAFLRSDVRQARTLDADGSGILVTLGGTDPHGITAAIAADLVNTDWFRQGGEVTVVLGGSYGGPTPWLQWSANDVSRLRVFHSPANFAELCAKAQVIICSASTTTYEVAYLQRAFVPLASVDNQVRVTQAWSAVGVGAGLETSQLDWRRRLITEVMHLVTNDDERSRRVAIAAGQVDGLGVKRVIDTLQTFCT